MKITGPSTMVSIFSLMIAGLFVLYWKADNVTGGLVRAARPDSSPVSKIDHLPDVKSPENIFVTDSCVQNSAPKRFSISLAMKELKEILSFRFFSRVISRVVTKLRSLFKYAEKSSVVTNIPNVHNDHLEMDVMTLGLTPHQLDQIEKVYNSKRLKNNETLAATATRVGVKLSRHLIYRYFAAVDWSPTYHGKSVEDAIVDTVLWRDDFNITNIETKPLRQMVANGLSYVSPNSDKFGRSIIHLNMGRNFQNEEPLSYLKLMMYTVERADQLSVVMGSGEFVTVIDLNGFSWSRCPPLGMMKSSMELLKMYYPYRMGGVFLVNGGKAFNLLWSILKPLMPKKALQKTFVLNSKEARQVLDEKVGLNNLAKFLGGQREDGVGNVEGYLSFKHPAKK